MDGNIGRLIGACGLAHFHYRSWDAPEVLIPAPEPPQVVETPILAEAILTKSPPAEIAVAPASPDNPPGAPLAAAIHQATEPIWVAESRRPLAAQRPPLTLPAPAPETPAADSLPRFRLAADNRFHPPAGRRMWDATQAAMPTPMPTLGGRPPLRLPAPEALPTATPARPTSASPVRRFALLDEIAPAPDLVRGLPDRRNPPTQPRP